MKRSTKKTNFKSFNELIQLNIKNSLNLYKIGHTKVKIKIEEKKEDEVK